MAKYSTPRIRPVRGGVRMRDLQKKAAYLYYYSGGGGVKKASNIVFSEIDDDSFKISCAAGGGDERLFILRAGGPVNITPVNGVTYAADAVFGDGEEIGINNFAVFVGSGTEVTVSHAGNRMRFDVAIHEIKGGKYSQAATASLVDPLLHSALQVYFNPDLITGVSPGGDIVSYTDAVGNVLTPTSDSRRPTLEVNVINGHAVIRVVANDNLRGVKSDFDFLHQGSNTLLYVFRRTSDSANVAFLDQGGLSGGIGRFIQFRTSGTVRDMSFNDDQLWQLNVGNVPVGEWRMIMTRFDADAPLVQTEVNNVQAASAVPSVSPSAETSTNLPIFFTATNGAQPCPGDLAYLVAFDEYLTDAVLDDLIGGLDFQL